MKDYIILLPSAAEELLTNPHEEESKEAA